MRRSSVLSLVVVAFGSGCYHYAFEQHPPRDPARVVVHEEHVPTYLNGFLGTGDVNVKKNCKEPVKTELRVTATDVLLSAVTLLVYTPHTLYVTCDADRATASSAR